MARKASPTPRPRRSCSPACSSSSSTTSWARCSRDPAPMIRIQGLRKSFGRQAVLKGVDLDVATGEIMIIIGRSGGGKSVLLKHLLRLMRPDAGAVLVDGVDITRLRGTALEEVRRRYGVVFQGGAL